MSHVHQHPDGRNMITPLRGFACFLVAVAAYFAFDAWFPDSRSVITVKEISAANTDSPDRAETTIQDVSGARYAVRGARYLIFGGKDGEAVRRVLKVGCRYEISYYTYSSFSRAAFPRDRVAISDAKLIDCPPRS